jgi:glycosyltransferase involved in cell wall biosynthesis
VASVQPTPIEGLESVSAIGLFDPSSSVAASLPGIRGSIYVLSDNAQAQIGPIDPHLGEPEAIWEWSQRAVIAGWRHIAAPDVLGPGTGSRITGNEQLSVQKLWGRTRFFGANLLIDGRCFTGNGPPTGTHHVVAELARNLGRLRRDAKVTLAVGRDGRQRAVEAVGLDADISIEEAAKFRDRQFDVVYRPYQFLNESEVGWTFAVASRVMLGQLDLIGFSNPSYHPSASMFRTARNLQRATMRRADRVVTISEFSLECIRSEVPDLESDRVSIIRCGADHVGPTSVTRPPLVAVEASTPFLACLSATFWHKNRLHAIKTVIEMRRRGTEVSLVIAGPEPFYGSSVQAENELIRGLSPADQAAIMRVGPVSESEKWWLLQNAAAVLYPSVVEGFGLVPFEAATVGTASLMGRTAALPEVFGTEVELVDSWRPSDWADVLCGWLADPELSARQVSAISKRSELLTWNHAALSTWDAIDLTLSMPKRIGHEPEGPSFLSMEAHRIGGTMRGRGVRHATRSVKYAARFAARLLRR